MQGYNAVRDQQPGDSTSPQNPPSADYTMLQHDFLQSKTEVCFLQELIRTHKTTVANLRAQVVQLQEQVSRLTQSTSLPREHVLGIRETSGADMGAPAQSEQTSEDTEMAFPELDESFDTLDIDLS